MRKKETTEVKGGKRTAVVISPGIRLNVRTI